MSQNSEEVNAGHTVVVPEFGKMMVRTIFRERMCRRGAAMKLPWAGAAFPLTPLCAWAVISTPRPSFGLICNPINELDRARLSSAREIEKTIHPLPKAA